MLLMLLFPCFKILSLNHNLLNSCLNISFYFYNNANNYYPDWKLAKYWVDHAYCYDHGSYYNYYAINVEITNSSGYYYNADLACQFESVRLVKDMN